MTRNPFDEKKGRELWSRLAWGVSGGVLVVRLFSVFVWLFFGKGRRLYGRS